MTKGWREIYREIVEEDASLKQHNTWGIAARAQVLVTPRSLEEAQTLLSMLDEPVLILGRGSNVLLPDEPIRRPVILFTEQMGHIGVQGETIRVQAGAGLSTLARAAAKAGLTGLEALSMIPGAVGGALLMNAGAHGQSIGDLVSRIRVLEAGTATDRWIERSDLTFSYRHSSLMEEEQVVLEAELTLRADASQNIEERMQQARDWRRRQPAGRSAGSVFKNPPGDSAGRLIEACGLKGTRIGGAVIAQEHGNFIINRENASCRDVLALICLCEQQVMKTHGIQLTKEVRVIDS